MTSGSAQKPPRAVSRERRWEAADTVVAVSTGLLFIVFAIFGLLCWQGYWSTLSSAKARAQTSADVLASETQWVVRAGLALLTQVEATLDGDAAGLSTEAREGFDEAAAMLPADVTLGLYDASGNPIAGGQSPRLGASIADTDFFAELSGGKDTTVSGQINGAEDVRVFVIAKRISDGGTFAGVALLTVGDDLLGRFWEPQKLGPDSAVSITRTDGWVAARYPALPAPLNISDLAVFEESRLGDSGTIDTQVSPVDGVARVVAFRHVEGLDLVTFASVSQTAVLTGLWTSILIVLALMGPIALALLAGSFLTARLLRQSARNQKSLANALEHNETLFREIHHRVKNNLQSVASLLQMQPIPKEIKFDMGQRIAAMSAVHEHIYRSNTFGTVRIKGYLQTLIASIRAGNDPEVEVVEELGDLSVDRDAAAPIGLILNEVVSNAFKHAFADGRKGRLVVTLSRENEKTGRLTVEDNGVGFDPAQPAKGIGRRLIGGLTSQVGGESHFDMNGGARFTLTFPLAVDGK